MDVVPGTPGAGGHRPPSPMLARNPARLLAVVVEEACRNALQRMLHRRGYVGWTTCSHPAAVMAVLRERRGEFDSVLIDMFAPREAVLELLERVESEMGLPVYVMSMRRNDNSSVRACRPLTMPAGMEEFETFLQSMMNRMSQESRSPVTSPDGESNGSTATSAIMRMPSSGSRATRRRNQERETTNQEAEQNSVQTTNHEAEQNSEDGEEQQQPAPKKQRLVWTTELHNKFVDAHDRLLATGDTVPKKILELMNDPILTRENVGSHLQKYRLTMKQRESHARQRANSRTRHKRDPPPQAHTMHDRVVPPQADFTTLDMCQQQMRHCQPAQRSSNSHSNNHANLFPQRANQSVQRSSNPLCDNSANLLSHYAYNLRVQPPTMTQAHCSAEGGIAYQNMIMAHQAAVTHQPAAVVAASGHMPMQNYSFNAQTVIEAPTASDIQNHCPENVSKEHMVPKVHVGDEAMERCIAQKEMHSTVQVGHESVAELAVPNSRHSDGSSQEDLSKIFQQYLNNDSEPSWDYEFLHKSD